MRAMLISCAFFLYATATGAQTLDPASLEFLKEAGGARTSEQIAEILLRAPNRWSARIFWNDAIRIAKGSYEGELQERAAVVRLVEAAIIRTGAEADEVPLDSLSDRDLASMRNALGFPEECGLLLHLLNRLPSLLVEPRYTAQYVIQRFSVPGKPVMIREWASRKYMDLSTEVAQTILDEEEAAGCENAHASEYAKTLSLNLAGVPDLILAAKALRGAERIAEKAVYPILIASYAVRDFFKTNQTSDFRPLVYFMEQVAISALRSHGGRDPFLSEELREREAGIPRVAFDARLFRHAAQAYAHAELSSQDRVARVAAAWGRALSLFAHGSEQAGPAFDRIAALIGADTPYHAGLLGLLVRYLPAEEGWRLGDVASWRTRVAEALGAGWDQTGNLTKVVPQDDFLRLMVTVGRPDIANRFLIDRLESVKGTPREDYLLRRFGAFARDYCYVISFRLSPESGWVRRETEGYVALLDFLRNFHSDGSMVQMAEVLVSDGTYEPYSAKTPEEDCATSFTAYSVVTGPLLGKAGEETRQRLEQVDDKGVRNFEGWALGAMSRKEPSPSIVPYIKLIYQDWFNQAFWPLQDEGSGASNFRYRAIGASDLTTVERVEELRQHVAATPHLGNLIQLFLDTRKFLEETYP